MADRVSFVFVHGAWHSSWYWQPVCSLLTASGHSAHAIDLPGAGEHAVNPEGYHPRSPQFVTETEPTRSKVTQEQRTRAVVDAVEAAIANDRRPVVLVAHSFGGASVTPGAELLGDKVAAVVYVSSFMLPPGWTPGDWRDAPVVMDDDGIKTVVLAGPPAIHAVRIDFRSADKAYQDKLRNVFGHDVDSQLWAQHLETLHPDEFAGVFVEKSPATPERYGCVPRHFVRCTEDRCIPIVGQDFIIKAMDDSGVGGRTIVHTLQTSHSPMLSKPKELVDILEQVAQSVHHK